MQQCNLSKAKVNTTKGRQNKASVFQSTLPWTSKPGKWGLGRQPAMCKQLSKRSASKVHSIQESSLGSQAIGFLEEPSKQAKRPSKGKTEKGPSSVVLVVQEFGCLVLSSIFVLE